MMLILMLLLLFMLLMLSWCSCLQQTVAMKTSQMWVVQTLKSNFLHEKQMTEIDPRRGMFEKKWWKVRKDSGFFYFLG